MSQSVLDQRGKLTARKSFSAERFFDIEFDSGSDIFGAEFKCVSKNRREASTAA